jgi:hypothetical protein
LACSSSSAGPEGRIERFSKGVAVMKSSVGSGRSLKLSIWSKNWLAVSSSSLAAAPSRYWVELACGSRSITRVRAPRAAAMAARLQVMVLLPTPPFWLNTTRFMTDSRI